MSVTTAGSNGQRVPPHDLGAEESLLGALLLATNASPASRQAIEVARERVTAVDFYKPTHGHIFDAINTLAEAGEPTDPVTVAAELRRSGLLDVVGGPAALLSLQAGVPSTSNAPSYARIIADAALLRRWIGVAGDIAEVGYAPPESVSTVADQVREMVANVEASAPPDRPAGLWRFVDLLNEAERLGEDFDPWLIPNLMKRTTRVVIIASSGSGKTLLTQQVGICAAAGLHPFTRDYLPNPIRVTMVDRENSLGRIVEAEWLPGMWADAKRRGEDPDDNLHVWSRRGAFDLTQRNSRVELENVIRETRPDLLCLGPIYKLAAMDGPGGMAAADKVMGVLDDLQDRYDFGLMLEGHPPGDNPGKTRGTEQWNYWPDMGFALVEKLDMAGEPLSPRQFDFHAMRGQRLKAYEWVEELEHSPGQSAGPWPWRVVRGPGEERF